MQQSDERWFTVSRFAEHWLITMHEKKSNKHSKLRLRRIYEPRRAIEDSPLHRQIEQMPARFGDEALVALEIFVADP
jgi:hypothetical protein